MMIKITEEKKEAINQELQAQIDALERQNAGVKNTVTKKCSPFFNRASHTRQEKIQYLKGLLID